MKRLLALVCVFAIPRYICSMDDAQIIKGVNQAALRLAVPIIPKGGADLQREVSSYLPFQIILKCRQVCKKWQTEIDKTYQEDLAMQTEHVNRKTEENKRPSRFLNSLATQILMQHTQEFTMDDLLAWEIEKDKEQIAIANDFFLWLHNYLNQGKNDMTKKRIERREGVKIRGPFAQAMIYDAKDCFDLLLKSDLRKNKPLEFAIDYGHTEYAKKLILAGAELYKDTRSHASLDPGFLGGGIYDAREHAEKKGNHELVQFIDAFTPQQFEQKPKKQKTKHNVEIIEIDM